MIAGIGRSRFFRTVPPTLWVARPFSVRLRLRLNQLGLRSLRANWIPNAIITDAAAHRMRSDTRGWDLSTSVT